MCFLFCHFAGKNLNKVRTQELSQLEMPNSLAMKYAVGCVGGK